MLIGGSGLPSEHIFFLNWKYKNKNINSRGKGIQRDANKSKWEREQKREIGRKIKWAFSR